MEANQCRSARHMYSTRLVEHATPVHRYRMDGTIVYEWIHCEMSGRLNHENYA